MGKALQLWGEGKNTESSNLFERISNAEKENWLPPFYVAYVNITASFGIKDEAQLKSNIDKANLFLDKAEAISPNNPEIIIVRALANTAYIAFDGQKYGMTLSGKNAALYQKALAIAPNNPRVVLNKAEWDMGGAKFFNQPIDVYCKDVQRAIELFKKEEITIPFYPKQGLQRAEQVLKQSCGK